MPVTCIYGLLRSLWSTASNACGSSLCGRAPCYNSYDALVSAYTGGTVSSSQTGSATGSGADDLLECPDPLLKVQELLPGAMIDRLLRSITTTSLKTSRGPLLQGVHAATLATTLCTATTRCAAQID